MYNYFSSYLIRCFLIVTSLFKKLVSVSIDRVGARRFARSNVSGSLRQLGLSLAMQAQNTGSASSASFLCVPKPTFFVACCCFAASSIQSSDQTCPPLEASNYSGSSSSTMERDEDRTNIESRASPEYHRIRLVHYHPELCLVSSATCGKSDVYSTLICFALIGLSCPSWHSLCQSVSRRSEPKATSCSSPAHWRISTTTVLVSVP